MRNIKLIIQYDGSRYKGWQRLGDSEMTIQGKIENVLSKMTGEDIEIIGSGRTDAGVHALKQVANFKTNCKMTTNEILDYCYRYLPDDIVVKVVENICEKFHARYNVRSKRYLYRILNRKYHDPFMRKYITHIPEALNLINMKRAASHFIGEHDFTSFTTAKSKKKSRVRKIFDIDINKDDSIIEIIFEGSGFLHNMVRIMTGTLIEVGLGRIKPEKIPEILNAKDRSIAGPTAPPQGLFLYDVEY
ncbi:tRNA pseudouridine(38-40) synthase TruA [Paramaledivibacter caminithermalis]|jgi:tRNA pseudouridine38-40 synthase|uniref:tRNA pseudouridine synthase A n=1 Tax=Paramaledivibacter caminithermalis (strain DSM 15212 / CIP 107654 / DViRD3) TaxID=1121301 RepID=A0A1M6LRT2_PARC5|nr:tRNA pseudouridine(38-40) synthase TruA [Paramaledivibacter caminithermalis]SHJ73909.1 tRNA pseudouridine38-40 synthase [Paramaledivibacter caminithermalis DSM 15212]